MMGSEWYREQKEQLMIQSMPCVKHGGGSIMVWTYMAVNRMGSLVFIDDMAADKSNKINSEVYMHSAHIQLNSTKLIG